MRIFPLCSVFNSDAMILCRAVITYALPTVAANLTLKVGGPLPAPEQVHLSRLMDNTDLGGATYRVSHFNGTNTSAMAERCQKACDADKQCMAWTYGNRAGVNGPCQDLQRVDDPCIKPGGCCCLKAAAPCPVHNSLCTSGVRSPSVAACRPVPEPNGILCTVHFVPQLRSSSAYTEAQVRCGVSIDTLRILASETTLDIRIFSDNTFAEIFFQKGRVAMTLAAAFDATAEVSVLSTASAVAEVKVFPISTAWTGLREVREAPRWFEPDGRR